MGWNRGGGCGPVDVGGGIVVTLETGEPFEMNWLAFLLQLEPEILAIIAQIITVIHHAPPAKKLELAKGALAKASEQPAA